MNTAKWKKLYSLASEIKSLKPWEWMTEHDIFGVQDSLSDITGYISVMGGAGEHYAITAYLGPQAVIDLDVLTEGPQSAAPDLFLEIPQLMLSFENLDVLKQKDIDLIKTLGLSFSGKNAWPLYRSFKPGLYPWFFNEEEEKTMIVYLEQAIDVFTRVKKDPEVLFLDGDEAGEKFLVRRPVNFKENKWEDDFEKILSESPRKLEFVIEKEKLNNYLKKPLGFLTLELDFFLLNRPTTDDNGQPFFPYLLLLVEKNSEMILGFEMLTAVEGFDEMFEEIPSKLILILSLQQSKPKKIHFQSERLFGMLENILGSLGVKSELKPKLKILNGARKAMETSMV